MTDFVCGTTQEATGNADYWADAHYQNCISDNGIMLKTTWPFLKSNANNISLCKVPLSETF